MNASFLGIVLVVCVSTSSFSRADDGGGPPSEGKGGEAKPGKPAEGKEGGKSGGGSGKGKDAILDPANPPGSVRGREDSPGWEKAGEARGRGEGDGWKSAGEGKDGAPPPPPKSADAQKPWNDKPDEGDGAGGAGSAGGGGGGGIGPTPDQGPGGMGSEPMDPRGLKRSNEKNPAFQYYALGVGSAGMCQMTFLDTSANSGSAPPESSKEAMPPCQAITAAHCLQSRVDPQPGSSTEGLKDVGKFTVSLQAPQLGERPVRATAYIPREYASHMTGGRGYHPKDVAIVRLPGAVCKRAVEQNGVQKLKACEANRQPYGPMYLMSHRLDKQSIVYATGTRFLPVHTSLEVAPRRPQPVIKQGDSGGPLVAAKNATESGSGNWECIMGVASTAPIMGPGMPAMSANYSAGAFVRDWIAKTSTAIEKEPAPRAQPANLLVHAAMESGVRARNDEAH